MKLDGHGWGIIEICVAFVLLVSVVLIIVRHVA